jgi:hypothetical protein
MSELFKTFKRRVWDESPLPIWVRDTLRMRRFVREAPPPVAGPAASSNRVAVVITPWFGSPAPWYSMTIGLLLAARGHAVTFVLDDQLFGRPSRIWRLQLAAIRAVMHVISQRYAVLRLSAFGAGREVDGDARAAIERLAYLNAVWLRKGESGIDHQQMRSNAVQMGAAQRAIAQLLERHPQDLLFVPGGICGTSGVWLREGQQRNIRVSTYDSGGYGVLLLAANGIACQLHDIPRAYTLLRQHAGTGPERDLVVGFAQEEIGKRRSGTDKFSSQLKGSSGKRPEYEGGVLIALNSPWDSAALGLHAVFETTQDWIVETVRHLLTHTEAPVLVRQHPVERLPSVRSVDDTRGLLRQHFGDHPRLHFIAAEDPVNSYDLMEQVKAMVVYTSTIGVEAAAHGKVVITESKSYYADLGFILKATDAESYYTLLSDAVAGRLDVPADKREAALFCYYITQCCNWVHTPFLVQEFAKWHQLGLDRLSREATVRSIVDAIASNTPISYINHQHRLAEVGTADGPALQS